MLDKEDTKLHYIYSRRHGDLNEAWFFLSSYSYAGSSIANGHSFFFANFPVKWEF